VPDAHFARPRHGGGVWAPSIRFHEDRFWIYYADPDFGIYVVTADDPRGQWTEPVLVKAGKGLIDPCPFWDEDRAGYLVHGWANSRAGISNRLTLHRLDPDNRNLRDAGRVVIDGSTLPGWNTIEGPKLHRRGDLYYIFAPAGGVSEGYQAVFRARSIDGPYEARVVLARGSTPVNGPHQGSWVDTPEGSHWFLHFQDLPAYGRVVHLQPMQWRDDGWPVIGDDSDRDGTGEPVLRHAKPRITRGPVSAPVASDEFDAPRLGLQWQWQANPGPGFHSLTSAPGQLRLACKPRPPGTTLWNAPHLLLQKFAGPAFVGTAQLRLLPANKGDRAGLLVFGFDYAWVGLRRQDSGLQLVLARCLGAHEGGLEQELFSAPFSGDAVHLRVTVQRSADCLFSWSVDGTQFFAMPVSFRARSSAWVGAKIGLFASGEGADAHCGHADFEWFRMSPE
jgi:beta-xylosidase